MGEHPDDIPIEQRANWSVIRTQQYLAAMTGKDYRHSVAIAGGKPITFGEGNDHYRRRP